MALTQVVTRMLESPKVPEDHAFHGLAELLDATPLERALRDLTEVHLFALQALLCGALQLPADNAGWAKGTGTWFQHPV